MAIEIETSCLEMGLVIAFITSITTQPGRNVSIPISAASLVKNIIVTGNTPSLQKDTIYHFQHNTAPV